MRFTLRLLFFIASFLLFALARTVSAQPNEFRLHFHKGDLHRVVITEILRIQMHFPQVDIHDVRPSVRTTDYSFKERVESVDADGSATIAATLDSFKTNITLGEGKHAENFFSFNSSADYDITHELHDIKVLPRAQFLGQTLRFVMRPDGTIKQFLNLQDFHDVAVNGGYDYDLLHAMLSLSDSLRMGQLLEYGFGSLAALNGTYTSPSTTAEIPITRKVTAKKYGPGMLDVHVRYENAPPRVEYLEGIAMPLFILDYYGAGAGTIAMSKNELKHSFYEDTAKVLLHVDIDTVPEIITRTVTTDIYPVSVMHGKLISIEDVKSGVDSSHVISRRGHAPMPVEGNGPQTAPQSAPQGTDDSPANKNSNPETH
ncbi:MAG TPA: hypothetical protein VGM92_09260 [Candidatus Kapabacteria bacterium]|jgi:hypothetical protein